MTFRIEGTPLIDLAAIAGASTYRTRDWLRRNGYRVCDGVARIITDPRQTEADILARLANAPRTAPCWRCGARECGHGDSRPVARAA